MPSKDETIRILKAKLDSMPDPTPQPKTDWSKFSWLATPAAIVVSGLLIVLAPHYLPSVDPTPGPPLPVPVVVEPTKFIPEDSIATLDGIRLNADRTKLICDLVNAGDGTFVLRYQPVGKAEIVRTIVVSGDKPAPLPPPKPDEPKPQPPPVVDPTTKPTAVTYVYEKDQGGVPGHVSTALNKINRDSGFKIVASIFEDDNTTGKSTVPAQYKAAYDAAKKEGLPVIVVTAGDKVLRTVKAPKTEQEILEAAK